MKAIASLLTAAALATAVACGTTAPATEPTQAAPVPDADAATRLHDIWALDRLGETAYAPVDGLEHPTLELNLTDLRAMGTDGCNRFTGAITEAGPEALHFGPLAGTRKLCRAGQDVSEGFNRALAQTTAYRLDDAGRLTLLDADGEALAVLRHVD